MKAFVEGVAVLAPGLEGWEAARAVLAGERPYEPAALAPPVPALLPAVERRRTGKVVKLALALGQEALAAAGREADAVATVFASSGNDGEVINDICIALASAERQVSPTRFHNSVHNAPAGYWSIATHSHRASTSVCAYDWSFALGLLEALAQAGEGAVMLVACDVPYPEPLSGLRGVTEPFGTALVLTGERTPRSLAVLELSPDEAARRPSTMASPALERLRTANPCARALPLLAALADGASGVVLERNAGRTMDIDVRPA
ncbi:MAG TPA: beta-ketoacyl synthase chain length factor [Burkholderiales bacterium]|nr:beta-ketoacyl synthase chain length factor [Burkholderiales bacterium]